MKSNKLDIDVHGRKTIIIDDAEYVLSLWADSIRPSVRRVKPKGDDRPSDHDDRRIQARAKVENLPEFRVAQPFLRIQYVVRAPSNPQTRLVCATFRNKLQLALNASPICVDAGPVVANDFLVSVTVAVEMLAGCEIYITEKTIRNWCKSINPIFNYKQGRVRYVKWSEVKARAPQRPNRAREKKAS